ncbi:MULTISPECIES: ArsR/SmtB family transcription factor [Paraburkholderia]|uniref:Winged helix-turn-helix transcriptional regulator n=1 Tax=Paraburkholderia podalyriae TaxID=1938811 RepID=A0ABR7PYY8_9BURK|nr:metalloregulator ArsR/SmtB family transcription factor [Paraburkholderia podalyriae]MBC8751399.1 winged helix-turn-helix transcriptional regulator [Paraburkholderia podalyriae]
MATLDSKLAVKALAALAQDTRLAVFRLLVIAGRSGMSPGAIAEKLGLPAPTLSFHLKELTHAGLVESKSQGRHIIYSASYDHMQALIDFLMENCCAAEQCACAPNEAEV